ncbi:MAG: polyprenyl synthetase family protein [Bdellovibrionota bacterium]|nr:polyprenyl synthetase family protein [Bdellovibrionota bacterium]
MLDTWTNEINKKLEEVLKDYVAWDKIREMMHYSLIPAGKLFRPLLITHLAKDLGEVNPEHYQFASSIETHHCYTLIHDDLPAMDNDDYRRGKLSSHKKFSEWEAILTGDALLNLSFQILAKLPPKYLPEILEIYGDYTGANGLIKGQIIDMHAQSKSLDDILEIHLNKTAALMQLSLEGCCILSNRPDLRSDIKEVGHIIGINFQLLDDLCELTEEVSGHEINANPFLNFPVNEIMKIIEANHLKLKRIFADHKLVNLQNYFEIYSSNILAKLNAGCDQIHIATKLETSSWDFLKN